MNSELFKLNVRDFAKGLAMMVLASVVTFLYDGLNSGSVIDWEQVLRVAIASGLGYILKNFLSTSDGKLLGKF